MPIVIGKVPYFETARIKNFITEGGIRGDLFPGAQAAFVGPANQGDGFNITLFEAGYTASDKATRVEPQTLYDIASITKNIIATAVLRLCDQGIISLQDPVAKFISLTGAGSDRVQIFHLLNNSVKFGLTEDLKNIQSNDERTRLILGAPVVGNLGQDYYYHNTTSIILGWVLKEVANSSLISAIDKLILAPARMENTTWYPDIERTAPTEVCPWRNKLVHAKVHDEISYAYLPDHVGSAGLFSTAEDLARFSIALMDGTFFQNNERMLQKMLKNYLEPYGRSFGLGFDVPAKDYICPCFSKETLVATGFTGCSMHIRTAHKQALILLTNSIHPVRKPEGLRGLRRNIAKEIFNCKHCND
jgi:CubicO group peptidase (beta-lactamase class C family)